MLQDGLMCSLTNQHMGNTAENIAARHNISREDQDTFAAESNRKALEAITNDSFKSEIVGVKIGDKVIDTDECPIKISPEE